MLSKSIALFIPKDLHTNEVNPSLKQSCILKNSILNETKKITTTETVSKVNAKRRATSSNSNGPLKKRVLLKTDPFSYNSANVSGSTCESAKGLVDNPVHAFDVIKNLNIYNATPFAVGSYQETSQLLSSTQMLHYQANILKIHDTWNYSLSLFNCIQQGLKYEKDNTKAPIATSQDNNTYSSQDYAILFQNNADIYTRDKETQGSEQENPNLYMELALTQDKENLSELQCLIRENIEIFTATEKDKNTHFRGRNWTVETGQVGVRCKHCYKAPENEDKQPKSSRYFPLNLSGIYQASQNIYHFHFKNGCCPNMPKKNLSGFNKTKPSRSCYRGGKQYWIMAAESLGVVESSSCLCMKDSTRSTISKQEGTQNKTQDNSDLNIFLNDAARDEKSLVNPDDRCLVTDYIFLLMCQMNQYPIKNGNDKNDNIPGLGLGCKHCEGHNGKGIFNRTKITSISKNEYFHQVHSHLDNCSHCPNQLKEVLNHLKVIHDVQKRKLKRGSRKEFFNRMLSRMTSGD